MKRALKEVIYDFQRGKNLESYVVLLVALAVLVVDIVGVADQALVNATILAVLSLLIYASIQNKRLLESQRFASDIEAFFAERVYLPPFALDLRNVRKEIMLVGVLLRQVTHEFLPDLEEVLERGCKVKILVLGAGDQTGKKHPWIDELGKVHTYPNLCEFLPANLHRLRRWALQLDLDMRCRLEIRTCETILNASAILIDRDHANGLIHTEPMLYKISPAKRPSFRVTPHTNRLLYDRLCKSYELLWREASPLFPDSSPDDAVRAQPA